MTDRPVRMLDARMDDTDGIEVPVALAYLRGEPLTHVHLTEDQAIRHAESLLRAVRQSSERRRVRAEREGLRKAAQ